MLPEKSFWNGTFSSSMISWPRPARSVGDILRLKKKYATNGDEALWESFKTHLLITQSPTFFKRLPPFRKESTPLRKLIAILNMTIVARLEHPRSRKGISIKDEHCKGPSMTGTAYCHVFAEESEIDDENLTDDEN